MNALNLLATHLRNHPAAVEFAETLATALGPNADQYEDSKGYAWEADIPARDQWETEAEGLAAHTRELIDQITDPVTDWRDTGTDAGQEHSERTGRRVVCVSDGAVGYWRDMRTGESMEQAADQFRAGYQDADGDPIDTIFVYDNGEEVANAR